MAKSIRSKTKRAFRRIKRQSGVYAVANAARIQRLSTKLRAKFEEDQEDDTMMAETSGETVAGEIIEEGIPPAKTTQEDTKQDYSTPKTISTSGPRMSRRNSWRLSKGKSILKKNPNRTNRLGGVAAKRRAGRPNRRR